MLAADGFMLVFRFLHVVSGALWVGAAALFTAVIGPSAAEVGPSAGPLLTAAVKKRKVAKILTSLAGVTVVAGWVMWFRDMDQAGGLGDWVGSGFGLGLTIGGLIATAAFFVGYLGVGRNVERLVDLGNEIAGSGGPPSDAQGAEMARLQAGLQRHGKTDLVLLLLAITAMGTARYW
jgi:hypothetical protein